MQFNDRELKFLVKTLRRRKRHRYTLFVFTLVPMGFWIALWNYEVFPVLQHVLVGFIAASVWFTWAFTDARNKQDKLI